VTLTLTAPARGALSRSHAPARSRLIQETGAALRDDPTVRRLRGKMTATLPRSVWMSFSFTTDHTPYRLTFPHTAATVTLWMAGLYQPWEALATWELADFATGDDVLTAVKAVICDPALDMLHRWLEAGGGP
jgi:hypothetical protein